MKSKKLRIILSAALVCISALLLIFGTAALGIVRYRTTDDKTQADAIIVLGAGIFGDEPSPVLRERLNHAISLYGEGYSDTLILTGGVGEGNARSESSVARDYVIAQGVPAEAVLIEEKSVITEQNLKYAKELMDEKGLTTAIVVSDPLHMKRAMLMAKDFGITAYSSPTPTTMYRSSRTKLPFLLRETYFYVGYYVLRPFR